MPGSRTLIIKIISIITGSLLISLYLISYTLAIRDREYYPSNIYWGSISLSSYPKKSLDIKKLTAAWGDGIQLFSPLHKQVIILPMDKCGIIFDYKASFENIRQYEIADKGISNLIDHILIRGKAQNVAPILLLDNPALLEHELAVLSRQLSKKPVDAGIKYNNNNIERIPAQIGYQLDIARTLTVIKEDIQNGSIGPWKLQFAEVEPLVNNKDTDLIKDLLAYAIKPLTGLNHAEMELFNLAIRNMNCKIILPGSTLSILSINEVRFPSDSRNSFLNKLREYIANALSNAGIDQELEINTIGNDLVLTNRMETPLAITANKNAECAELRIWGKQKKGKNLFPLWEESEVPIETETVIDYQLCEGQQKIQREGKAGKKLQVYVVIEQDNYIEKRMIYEDVTPGIKEVILIGPYALNK